MKRLALVLLLVVVGCERTTVRPEPPIAPTPLPPIVLPTRIEYRVTGTHQNVTITYVTSTQGTTVIKTDLPWFLGYDTVQLSTFVYLQADASLNDSTEGPLIAQIFVNGVLFRETRGQGFNPSVTASGEVVR